MTLLTILSSIGLDTWDTGRLFGYGLLAGLIVALTFSAQRWLLAYIVGGIAYGLAVEGIHSLLLNFSTLEEWRSYVIAIGISWLPLFAWVLYRALRYDTVSYAMQKQQALASARYIEHSPIYDDDYQPRFE